MSRENDLSHIYGVERKNCINIHDDLILRRLELYKKLIEENEHRLSACRDALEERHPQRAAFLNDDENIEDVLNIKKPHKVQGALNEKRENNSKDLTQKTSAGLAVEVVNGREDSGPEQREG